MEHDFLTFVNQHRLFGPTDRVLLAVSGGLDSAVMANLFHRAGQPFGIAHCNFGLRGAASDADADFVKNMALRYGVPFYQTRFDTKREADAQGESLQMAARRLRYDWFEDVRERGHYVAVATAHHLGDVLETILLNLTRGTGLAGLAGIPVRSGDVVRPLLWAERAQLEDYADENGVQWRDDESNATDAYARNRLRHHVVDTLLELNPSLYRTLDRTTERLRAAHTLVQHELDASWANVAQAEGVGWRLRKRALAQLAEPGFRLAEWLRPYGFSYAQSHDIWAAVRAGGPGQTFRSATHRLLHDRDVLHLLPLPDNVAYDTVTLPDWPAGAVTLPFDQTLRIEKLSADTVQFSRESNVAFLDADQLRWPLTIRPWRLGDRLRPLGLNGHKLVSDLLNDQKVSQPAREQALVLCAGDAIAWVIGHRIAHDFRITDATRNVAKLTVTT